MDANARVAAAVHCDLAYFLQDSGLCEAYCKWYDDCAPLQRLLRSKEEAREVWDLLQEGKKRKYEPRLVAETMQALVAPHSAAEGDGGGA